MVESQVISGHIVLLDLVAASPTSVSNIKMTRLDRINEVFVGLHNRLICVGLWIDY